MTALPIERAERAERAGRAGRTRPADPSAPRTAGGLGIVEHAADKLGRLAPRYDGLAMLVAIRDGELPPPPVADLLGFEIRALAPGEVTFAMQPSLEHYNPIGMVHGGIAATLLDTVMGCAVHTLLPAGVGYSTLDISVRYLRPITVDTQTVVATGTVVHHGRRTATAEGRIVAADTGRLLATATSTLLVIGR
jgi:uncharacterized protein (TIGR00369 family)